ncbi:MAG: hypothetical protein Q7T05_05575, partial [Dehalococcoidia bacterium]|nr:hypothetical protein [Dehalococcoidia bacterium]
MMSRIKWFFFPGITLLLLILAFCVYWYVYIPSQMDYFSNRNLRLLKNMSQQIEKSIKDLRMAIQNAVGDPPVPVTYRDLISVLDQITPKLNIPEKKILELEKKKMKEKKLNWILSDGPSVGRGAGIEFIYKQAESSQSARPAKKITMSATLREILSEPIVSKDIFDALLVVQKDGKVLYDRYKGPASSLSVVDLQGLTILESTEHNNEKETFLEGNWPSSLVSAERKAESSKRPDTESRAPRDSKDHVRTVTDLAHFSNTFEVLIAGTRYKLFVQPITAPIKGDDAPRYLCGLIRADHFLSESKEFSYNHQMFAIFLVVLVLMSFPTLKLKYMSGKDRTRKSDLVFLSVSLLVGSGLTTLVLADVFAYQGLSSEVDHQLKAFADSISAKFQRELSAIYKEVEKLNADFNPNDQGVRKAILAGGEGGSHKRIEWQKEPYPYFDKVFWINPTSGQQIAKWAIDTPPATLINVNDRVYFKSSKDNEYLFMKIRGQSRAFVGETIRSMTTGKNAGIVAIPGSNSTVAVIEVPMLSLLHPVLPPGFGFAFVNHESGRVIFHSDAQRIILNENFFDETDRNPFLRAAVFGRTSNWVTSGYWGSTNRFYVRPLHESMKSALVVFNDQKYIRTINIEALGIAMLLFVLYVVLFGIAAMFLICGMTLWSYRRDSQIVVGKSVVSLWPDSSRLYAYLAITGINVIASIYLLLYILSHSSNLAILAQIMFVPLLVVVAAFVCLKKARLEEPNRIKRITSAQLCRSYVWCWISSLILVSAIPALGCFTIAFSNELEVMLKHAQSGMARDLQDRILRISRNYDKVEIKDKEAFLSRLLGYDENAQQIIDDNFPSLEKDPLLDVYQRFYYDTHIKYMQSDPPPDPPPDPPLGESPICGSRLLSGVTDPLKCLLLRITIPYNQY